MAYTIELIGRDPMTFDRVELLRAMEAELGQVILSPGDEGSAHFFCKAYPLTDDTDGICAQVILMPTEFPFDPAHERTQKRLSQSWRCPEAKELVPVCRHTLLFSDLMALTLAPLHRERLLRGALKAVLRCVPCDLLSWTETEQFTLAKVTSAALDDSNEGHDRTHGFVNVRFYNVTGRKGVFLMDTLGLSAFMLPDLQMLFTGLDTKAVAQRLFEAAEYVLQQGDVIETGNTLEGWRKDQKWRCRRQVSMVAPERDVIDLDPGVPNRAADYNDKWAG